MPAPPPPHSPGTERRREKTDAQTVGGGHLTEACLSSSPLTSAWLPRSSSQTDLPSQVWARGVMAKGPFWQQTSWVRDGSPFSWAVSHPSLSLTFPHLNSGAAENLPGGWAVGTTPRPGAPSVAAAPAREKRPAGGAATALPLGVRHCGSPESPLFEARPWARLPPAPSRPPARAACRVPAERCPRGGRTCLAPPPPRLPGLPPCAPVLSKCLPSTWLHWAKPYSVES